MPKKTIFDIQKQQIEKQTRPHLHTNVTKAKVTSVNENDVASLRDDNVINPIWTRGYYILDRVTTPNVDEFLSYSGNIRWDLISNNVVASPDVLDVRRNDLLGIRVFSKTGNSLILKISTINCICVVYTIADGETGYRKVFESTERNINRDVIIGITSNVWTSIFILLYTVDSSGSYIISSPFTKIDGTQIIDITSPGIPTWHTTPIVREIVDDETKYIRLRLQWDKDTSFGFGGNGIYRKQTIFSGMSAANPIPATIYDNLYLLSATAPTILEEKNKWLHVFSSSSTINSGDYIRIGSSSATVHRVSQVKFIKKNYIDNPYFVNGDDSSWDYHTDYAFGTTPIGRRSDGYVRYDELYTYDATPFAIPSLVTDNYYALSTSLKYYVSMVYSNNVMNKRNFGLGGYGSTPSNWDVVGGVTAEATITSNNKVFTRIVRSGVGSLKCSGDAIYFSTTASINIAVTASMNSEYGYFNVTGHLNSGTLACNFGTFVSGISLNPDSTRYHSTNRVSTPSTTGWGYLCFNIPATNPTVLCATIDILNPRLGNYSHHNPTIFQIFKIEFYNWTELGGYAATSTPYYFNVPMVNGYTNFSLVLGTLTRLPLVAPYIKLKYFPQGGVVNSKGGHHFVDIYGFQLTEEMTLPMLSVAATDSTFIRLEDSLDVSVVEDDDIYLDQFEHIYDRPRRDDDGSVVFWYDYDIEPDATYSYYLDAYDTSIFKNRSAKSTIATLYTGDLISPKAPSSYSCVGAQGGIIHTFTTPTASDLRYIRAYDDNTLSNIKWTMIVPIGATNQRMYYHEPVTATALATRCLTALDSWYNESTYAEATCTPLPAQTLIPNFSIVLKDKSGDYFSPNENGWYNATVVASLSYLGSSPINSYYYGLINEDDPSAFTWSAFNGTLSIAPDGNDVRFTYNFYVDDIYGYESEVKELKIKVDTDGPDFSLDGDAFWDHGGTSGYDGYNLIKWYPNKVTDNSQSGVSKFIIKRAKVTPMYPNADFENSYLSGSKLRLYDWSRPSLAYASLYAFGGTVCSGKYVAKVSLVSGSAVWVQTAAVVTIQSGDVLNMCGYMRSQPAVASIAELTGYWTVPGGGYTYGYYFTKIATSTHWEYLHYKHSYSGIPTPVRWAFRINAGTGETGSSMLFDNCCMFLNSSLSTIAEVGSNTSSYLDRNIEPWSQYVYAIYPVDAAGNMGTLSPFKPVRAMTTYRDKYRNMLPNSSFERTTRTAGGTLVAESWSNWYWSGQFTKTYKTYPELVTTNPYQGENCVGFNSLMYQGLYMNDIHLLPYSGYTRNFVVSVYRRGQSNGYLTVYKRNSQRAMVGTPKILDIAVHSAQWERAQCTFSVSLASIVYLDLNIIGGDLYGASTLYIDAVQLEEKPGLPPTDYYDANVITADHIQGALIRGNWIEANQIYANHIKAGTITATQIKAGTISATLIKSQAITGTLIKESTITATHLKIGIITGTLIKESTITATHIKIATITGTLISQTTITATNIKTGTINATLIKAGTITGTLIKANSITATQIKANTIEVENLKVNDDYLYIKGVPVVAKWPVVNSPSTVGYFNLVPATLGINPGIGFLHANIDILGATRTFRMGVCNSTGYPITQKTVGTLANYTYGVPRLAAGHKGSSYGGLMYVTNSTGALYKTFVSAANSGSYWDRGWGTPVFVKTGGDSNYISSNSRLFRYGSVFWGAYVRCNDTPASGTLFISKYYAVSGNNYTDWPQDITITNLRYPHQIDFSLGTDGAYMFVAYTINSSDVIQFKKIYLTLSYPDPVLCFTNITTFDCYGGLDKTSYDAGGGTAVVSCVRLVRLGQTDKFILLWSYENSSFMYYYKIIDESGNIIIGNDKDLEFLPTVISDNLTEVATGANYVLDAYPCLSNSVVGLNQNRYWSSGAPGYNKRLFALRYLHVEDPLQNLNELLSRLS